MTGQERMTRHVVIRGRVQGIGYRSWAEREALSRSLEGWVRNRRDGSVEAVFAGPPGAVTAMIEACRIGPALARIDGIDVREATLLELAERRAIDRFSLLPTA